ncbi:ATP-dependent DNA helicase PIF1 [Beauveria bassiana ARSEF 2860]|uniref:ATP-dependent DNA helicase PIF1 n=1 Tax=Beauveria bassiana (strain ARSEF 2860) TaxID=655819 RepID=J5J3C1_BEAB2|nr:ATP-dependent DNA helicase PIF1 [Beauveria bassiana ARSEF 2860]EJP61238.1 ATP-dependent DNA helicase PIF1 [Beauveria bassiana ARSEF 2860]
MGLTTVSAKRSRKPLYYDRKVQGVEIQCRNAYRRFDKTVFLKVAQRQRDEDQEAFRTALGKLRQHPLFTESWELLSGRVQAKLADQEVTRPVIQITARTVGTGAAAAPDDKAEVGLCNGARGTVYDMAWAPGANPIRDQPCAIMIEFDKYTGPAFLTTTDGRKIVPILSVDRDFLIRTTLCTRTRFPLIVCYAITVHKSQSITEDTEGSATAKATSSHAHSL